MKWLRNPVTAILQSNALPGLKIIALSLLLLFVTALPYMLYVLVVTDGPYLQALGVVFGIGALAAHMGFIVGLSWLIWNSLLEGGNSRVDRRCWKFFQSIINFPPKPPPSLRPRILQTGAPINEHKDRRVQSIRCGCLVRQCAPDPKRSIGPAPQSWITGGQWQ